MRKENRLIESLLFDTQLFKMPKKIKVSETDIDMSIIKQRTNIVADRKRLDTKTTEWIFPLYTFEVGQNVKQGFGDF